jgi:hypothetical protein
MALSRALLCLLLAACASCGNALVPTSARLSTISVVAQRATTARRPRALPPLRSVDQQDQQESVNDKLIYDARSGRFYEKKIEEVRLLYEHVVNLKACK